MFLVLKEIVVPTSLICSKEESTETPFCRCLLLRITTCLCKSCEFSRSKLLQETTIHTIVWYKCSLKFCWKVAVEEDTESIVWCCYFWRSRRFFICFAGVLLQIQSSWSKFQKVEENNVSIVNTLQYCSRALFDITIYSTSCVNSEIRANFYYFVILFWVVLYVRVL